MKIGQVLQSLADTSRQENVPFIVVGGWALNAHGVSRQTLDIDILVRDADLAVFESILSGFGYSKVYSTELFAKFRSDEHHLMDIDCLMTDAGTLEKMLTESQVGKIGDVQFAIPALSHLIAMKLHALKHNFDRRHGRDLPDIVGLVEVNGVDVHTDDFKNLCLSFGTKELYEEIVKAVF